MLKSLALSLTVSLSLFGAACATTSDAAPAAPAHRASTPSDDQSLCVQTFTHARTCSDAYIPALVDSRAKYDIPQGIADQVKADRDAVIAQARTEWASDSTDAAIAQNCERMAQSANDADRDTARSCNAKTDCGEFTSCIMPVFENHFAK